MADKLSKTYKVDFSFTAGEAPTPSKLNAWSKQISNALSIVEKAIGDVWDESYPYFDTSDTLSNEPIKPLNMSNSADGDRKLEIANIARLIGPSSALNPIHPTNLDAAELIVTEILIGGNINYLKYPVDSSQPIVFTDDTANAFDIEVTNDTLSIDSEYYFDYAAGVLVSYTNPDPNTKVTYYVKRTSNWTWAEYFSSSYNVIPDKNQSTKCVCTGPDVNGLYTVTLPTLTDAIVLDDLGYGSALTENYLGYNTQLKLPQVLSGLSSGDVIPSGFLFTRDDDSVQEYKEATYYYVDQTSIKVGGATLDTTHGFTVITVGTSITESLAYLRYKLWRLQRGLDANSIFSATRLKDVFGLGPESNELYVQSEADLNPLPQYLHRDGWFGSNDSSNINDQNGMRGDLMMLSSVRSSGTRNHLTDNSNKLVFGRHSDGPYLRLTNAGGASGKFLDLVGSSSGLLDKGVRVVDTLIVEDGIYSGTDTTDENWGPLKWYIWTGTLVYSAGTFTAIIGDLTGKTIISVTGMVYDTGTSLWYGGGYGSTIAANYELQPVYNSATDGFGFLTGSNWSADADGKLIIMYKD